jgi:hypothetical protein
MLCVGRAIDPAVVTSRQEVGDFYRTLAAGEDPSGLRLMNGWRRAALGEPLAKLYQGIEKVRVSWADGALRVEPGSAE